MAKNYHIRKVFKIRQNLWRCQQRLQRTERIFALWRMKKFRNEDNKTIFFLRRIWHHSHAFSNWGLEKAGGKNHFSNENKTSSTSKHGFNCWVILMNRSNKVLSNKLNFPLTRFYRTVSNSDGRVDPNLSGRSHPYATRSRSSRPEWYK